MRPQNMDEVEVEAVNIHNMIDPCCAVVLEDCFGEGREPISDEKAAGRDEQQLLRTPDCSRI